jgi:hypothetical protein
LNLEVFVGTQKSIESFRIYKNFMNGNRNFEIYERIFAHVFNLETLSSVKTNYALPFLRSLEVRNPHVRKLSLEMRFNETVYN